MTKSEFDAAIEATIQSFKNDTPDACLQAVGAIAWSVIDAMQRQATALERIAAELEDRP